MLDAITELTPDFRVPYSAGAIALSVLVDDREGATKIFEKAVARFPDDWVILYRAGYHFLFEVNDPVRAQDLLVRAARQGAPPWVYSLASRLASKEGQTELAVRILEQALATDPRPEVRMRLEQRLTELQGAP
jgi:tetratricopeptide (TPR) repeat protein